MHPPQASTPKVADNYAFRQPVSSLLNAGAKFWPDNRARSGGAIRQELFDELAKRASSGAEFAVGSLTFAIANGVLRFAPG